MSRLPNAGGGRREGTVPHLVGDSVPRLDPDRMVEGSRPGFLERFADSYAILADLRNCRGVTPTGRLK